jgi:hypothetical protein
MGRINMTRPGASVASFRLKRLLFMDEDLTPAEEPPATDVETLAQAAGTPAVGARPLVPTAENPAP